MVTQLTRLKHRGVQKVSPSSSLTTGYRSPPEPGYESSALKICLSYLPTQQT